MTVIAQKTEARCRTQQAVIVLFAAIILAAVSFNPVHAGNRQNRAGLKTVLKQARISLGIGTRYFKTLDRFYRSRNYRHAWSNSYGLTESGWIVLGKLKLVYEHGLDPADFPLPKHTGTKPTHLDDIRISFSLIRYAEQVQAGRLSPNMIVAEVDLKPVHPDLLALLNSVVKSKDPSELMEKLPPKHKQYKLLKKKLAAVRENQHLLVRTSASMGGHLLLAAKNKLDALQSRLIANMERWRWLPRELGNRHIWINLPTYKVEIINNGKPEFVTRGIIGRKDAPTPLITSKIKNIIVNPFWHLPASVVARDILPKLGSDPVAYLKSRSIKVLRRGGRIVDPAGIDWAKITNPRTYRFRQSPGPKNALGRMKILFPNSHAIYLHDTNEPELFSSKQRALSHGCVRLSDPVEFADAIAGYDNHLESQMPGTLIGKRERWLKYKAHMPVHLVYFTAQIDRTGKLVTYPDIYHYDDKITRLFKQVGENS